MLIKKMKNFFNYCSLFFACLILILNNSEFAYGIGNVDWELLKENNDGKEWIDRGSIKSINDNEIVVLTKYFKNAKESSDKGQLFLYVMKINCDDKTFKDTSINGIPQFGSKWQTANNDELINVVIEKSCSERINK